MHTVALALVWSGCTSTEPSSRISPGGPVVPVGVEDARPDDPVVSDAPSSPGELRPFENPPLVSVPLFGGTLEAVPELHGALASDPQGDRVVWMPRDGSPVEVALGSNARPFRIEVEGSRAWVTLRGTGEVVALDLPSGALAWRAKVCPEPRGLDHGPDGALVVACAGGELVALDDATGAVDRWRLLASDLRDVVSADGILYVSRFRAAEVLLVDPETLASFDLAPLGVAGRVAWRMRHDPSGEGALVVYDEPSTETIGEETDGTSGSSGYGTSDPHDGPTCEARHQVRFARVVADGVAFDGAGASGVVLPVDFLVRADGTVLVVNGGGSATSAEGAVVDLGRLDRVLSRGVCIDGTSRDLTDAGLGSALAEVDGELWIQTAFHAVVQRGRWMLGDLTPVWDDGAALPPPNSPQVLFHADPGTTVTCASCHPEGQDDGQVWTFGAGIDGVAVPGPRRTLPLAGHVLARAPYHWMGELPSPGSLMDSTFTTGMGGEEVARQDTATLFAWLDGLRPVHKTPSADPETIALGEEVFQRSGCAACHGGEALTTNEITRVRGTLASKTPTLLGLGMHLSFMHDGCAPTLLDRFLGPDSCTGGAAHGATGALTPAEILALTAYLETL